jgi:hypothetical protein
MKGFDPLSQLISREAVRFIGTVSDLVRDSLAIYISLTEAFASSEIRSAAELAAVIQSRGTGCSLAVARNTIEVAAGLRILMAIPQGGSGNRKFSLGESGRVIRAATNHPSWSPSHIAALFMRPMFESHGDYLLQALSAAGDRRSRDGELTEFTRLVRELAAAKLAELPVGPSGLSWDTYVTELRHRQALMDGQQVSASSDASKPDLATLQSQHRKRFEALTKTVNPKTNRDAGNESKTFQHQLTRCRSWLEDLGLIERLANETNLTNEGRRVLSFFESHTNGSGPVRIPPTAALLKDTFRFSDDLICDSWGNIVDDEFWELGLYNTKALGTYQPSEPEFIAAVNSAFDQVRVKQVSEASISPLRQAIFLSFLFSNRPIRSKQLTLLLDALLENRGDLFGLGRNRQGRPAFIFRKSRT